MNFCKKILSTFFSTLIANTCHTATRNTTRKWPAPKKPAIVRRFENYLFRKIFFFRKIFLSPSDDVLHCCMNIGIGSIRNISLLLATKTSYSATFFSSQDKKFIPLLCSKNHHPWSLGEHFHKLEASFSFLMEKQSLILDTTKIKWN